MHGLGVTSVGRFLQPLGTFFRILFGTLAQGQSDAQLKLALSIAALCCTHEPTEVKPKVTQLRRKWRSPNSEAGDDCEY
jgi:hypothetical protein